MSSRQHKENIKSKLTSLTYDIDNLYYTLENEIRSEIIQRKEKIDKANEETNEIYDKLLKGNEHNALKLIKSVLPLRVKLLNKINWQGHGIYNGDEISVWFYFNEDIIHCFRHDFSVAEVKRILKYKEN